MLSWLSTCSVFANGKNATARNVPDQHVVGLCTAALPI
jgi:hypothetical protein